MGHHRTPVSPAPVGGWPWASLSCPSNPAPSTSSPASAIIRLLSPTGTAPITGSSAPMPIAASSWVALPGSSSPIGMMPPLTAPERLLSVALSGLSSRRLPVATTSSSSLKHVCHPLPTARASSKPAAPVPSLPRSTFWHTLQCAISRPDHHSRQRHGSLSFSFSERDPAPTTVIRPANRPSHSHKPASSLASNLSVPSSTKPTTPVSISGLPVTTPSSAAIPSTTITSPVCGSTLTRDYGAATGPIAQPLAFTT